MASFGKIPVFAGEDYAFWKVRMRAFLQSMGAKVWEITKNQAYEVLAIRTTLWRNHPKLLGPGALIFVAKQL